MSLRIAGIAFERHHYDPRGDVLYLNVPGYDGLPPHAICSDEGHNVEWDESGRVIAMTLINVRWYLERDGVLTITLPTEHLTPEELAALSSPSVRASAEELAPALKSAA